MRQKIWAAILSVTAALVVSWLFAQSGASHSAGSSIYFLKDDLHERWCGYASESRFKTEVQLLRAQVVGKTDYMNGRVSVVHVTITDESGDWAVNDDYTLDNNQNVRSLKRTINILPEDTSEEQLFVMEKGQPHRQRSAYRDLRSGQSTRKRVDWFQAPPIITELTNFPFGALIFESQYRIWTSGQECVSEGRRGP